ncbi:hypothetical protein [Synechococcus sp. PCC 7336]|uniref:hypothetical protein n=1 Tax=Synechococcus sp. PCC 7336 TaxID=195250 RepID=UPI00056EAB57|nr:hypothetical protein [Synechococcus sp. PCC 7336]
MKERCIASQDLWLFLPSPWGEGPGVRVAELSKSGLYLSSSQLADTASVKSPTSGGFRGQIVTVSPTDKTSLNSQFKSRPIAIRHRLYWHDQLPRHDAVGAAGDDAIAGL